MLADVIPLQDALSQWSLTFEVRKRPRQAGATIKTTTRRNGA